MEKVDPEKRFEAKWCWDSETGEKLLINMVSGQVLVRGKDLRDMAASDNEVRMLEDAKMWEKGFDDGYNTAKRDYEETLWDLNDQLTYLREEFNYLRNLDYRTGEDTIQ
jgi:hypothetical protein